MGRCVKVFAKDSNAILFLCSLRQARKYVQKGLADWMAKKRLKAKVDELTADDLRSIKTRHYGNCMVLAPDGEIMFHCNQEKINWYLNRKLADLICEDPTLTIQLKFQPNGLGHRGDDYYLTPKINQCVVCGTTTRLTRHHVVPFCYRRHFPMVLKDHNYHDVLLLCIDCHNRYEEKAQDLKKKLAFEYNIPLLGSGWYHDNTVKRLKMHSSALLKHWEKIPNERREILLQTLRNYYKKEEITQEEIVACSKMEWMVRKEDFVQHGPTVVAKISEKYGGLEEFIMMWRKHFLTTMEPKYMPAYWSVDRPIDRVRDSFEQFPASSA